MMNLKGMSLASISSKLFAVAVPVAALACLLVAQAPRAYAGADEVFGSMWAWDNNFNSSNIWIDSWGSTSQGYASFTVGYDFGTGNLYGYPACIRGWHYGWNPANDHKYPAKISTLGSDTAWFNWNMGGSGIYGDFAYDMFLRSDSNASTPQVEVMIWGQNNSYPIGTKVATNTVNGNDLWMGYNSSAGYETFSFVPKGTGGGSAMSGSGSLDINIGTYLNYLTAHYGSYLNQNWYLDVVEAGQEVEGGNAWVYLAAGN